MTINLHCWGNTYTYLNYVDPLSDPETPWKCFRLRRFVAFQPRHELRSNPNQSLLAII